MPTILGIRLNMLSFTPAIQNSCQAQAISSRHDLKSIGTGNLYLGPLHIIDQILESVMIFKSPVTL